MTNSVHKKATDVLDIVSVVSPEETVELPCLSIDSFSVGHVPYMEGATPQVAFLAASNDSNSNLSNANLILDLADENASDVLLQQMVKAAVYNQMKVEEHDEALDSLIVNAMKNYRISFGNIVRTVIQAK